MDYSALNEQVYRSVLPSGACVCVIPKRGFSKKYAYLAVNYGSIDTSFQIDGQAFRTPDGVAHYLEHKMFDLKGRDVMQEFAALGASPNAFTSYSMTAYYFNCTSRFDECLDLLLEFVCTPFFTDESVEKERGIIGQEVRMYEDSPDSRVYEDLFAAMYRTHPVRIPIAGSVESIAGITAETLLQCYGAFYTPRNMVLCVVGDVEPERIADAAARWLDGGSGPVVRRDYGPAEDRTCLKNRTCRTMDLAMPTFQAGFKLSDPGLGAAAFRTQLIGDLAAEALMGESSRLYQKLYDGGWIDGSFAAGYEDLPRAALLSCGGDSRDPERVCAEILEEARRIRRDGIDPELFVRLKRSAMGRSIRGLDSFESICYRVCAYWFTDFDYFCFPEVFRTVEKEDAEAFLQDAVTELCCAMSVIVPRKEG